MREIMVPIDSDAQQEAEHIVSCMDSAFLSKDQLKTWIANAITEAALKAKAVECRRIEKFIYDHPESVEINKKKMSIRYGAKLFKKVSKK